MIQSGNRISNKISVVIAEWDLGSAECLKEFLINDGRFEINACISDGRAVKSAVQNTGAELVIMESALRYMSGRSVIRELKSLSREKRPKTLMLSSRYEAQTDGADAFLLKPVMAEEIARCAAALLTGNTKTDAVLKAESEAELTRIRIPIHYKGYKYLAGAILRAVKEPEIMDTMTKKLYPEIAHEYGTKPYCVERAMRNAVEGAWERGGMEAVRSEYAYAPVCKPTNSELITMAAAKVRERFERQFSSTAAGAPALR